MPPKALQSQIALGEDSKRQFKVDVRNEESLAAEMAAFANSEGGQMFLGVADDGSTPGLASADISRINQLISNAASQLVRSPLTVQTQNVSLGKGRVVIVLTVPKGIDKPYFDKNGVIWLKTVTGQTGKSNENHPMMDQGLAECQLAEVLVLGHQRRGFCICSIQHHVIRNAWFHFRNGKHLMSSLSQSGHDGKIEVFVSQKFHAAWPETG